jgi:hypothetical protein
VRVQGGGEQAVGEQLVRAAAHLSGAEQQVHHAQERPLGQEGPDPGEQARSLAGLQRGELAAEALGLLAVSLAEFLQFRREPGLRRLPAQGAEAERGDQQPHRHGEDDDARGGGEAAEHGGQCPGEGVDEVIGGVHGDAKEAGHDDGLPGRWVIAI